MAKALTAAQMISGMVLGQDSEDVISAKYGKSDTGCLLVDDWMRKAIKGQ